MKTYYRIEGEEGEGTKTEDGTKTEGGGGGESEK